MLIRGNHETFNRSTRNEGIHNLRDVRDRDAAIKKVIGSTKTVTPVSH